MLNIQAELVDTTTESQLWGEQFRQKTTELLTAAGGDRLADLRGAAAEADRRAEEEAAQAADRESRGVPGIPARAVPLAQLDARQLPAGDRALRARASTHDPALRAGLCRARRRVRRAVVLRADRRRADGFPRARAAALRAHRDRSARSPTRTSRSALERLFYGWDWPAAEAELHDALRAEPELALAHARPEHLPDHAAAGSTRRWTQPAAPGRSIRCRRSSTWASCWAHHSRGRYEEADARGAADVRALKPGLEEAGNILITSLTRCCGRSRGGRRDLAAAVLGHAARRRPSSLRAFRAAAATATGAKRLAQMDRGARTRRRRVSCGFAIVLHVASASSTGPWITSSGWSSSTSAAASSSASIHAWRGCAGMPRFEAIVKRVGVPLPQTVSGPRRAST